MRLNSRNMLDRLVTSRFVTRNSGMISLLASLLVVTTAFVTSYAYRPYPWQCNSVTNLSVWTTDYRTERPVAINGVLDDANGFIVRGYVTDASASCNAGVLVQDVAGGWAQIGGLGSVNSDTGHMYIESSRIKRVIGSDGVVIKVVLGDMFCANALNPAISGGFLQSQLPDVCTVAGSFPVTLAG